MTLLSVSEEKTPLVSLIRPMIWQVVDNKLAVNDEDSATTKSLKKAIVDLLTFRYADDRISAILDLATFVDPR